MIMTSPAVVDQMKINSRRRGKFSGCFKPTFDAFHDEDGEEPFCNSKSSPPPPPSFGDESSGGRKKRSPSSHRVFAAAFKDVFSRTSMAKKSHSPKQVDHQFISSDSSSKNRKLVKEPSMKRSLSEKSFSDRKEISRCNSDSSSLMSSSSSSITSSTSSSASSYCSRSGPETLKRSTSLDLGEIVNPTINYRQVSRKRGNTVAGSKCMYLCVLLVCLVSLVFWGKFFAIATCTITWLFFRRMRGLDSPGNEMFDSREYKKRVIMDGLLERNRHRVL